MTPEEMAKLEQLLNSINFVRRWGAPLVIEPDQLVESEGKKP